MENDSPIQVSSIKFNSRKTFARMCAMQILYEFDFHNGSESIDSIKNNFLEYYFTFYYQNAKIHQNFLEKLLTSANNRDELDLSIKQTTKDELDLTVSEILRLMVFELIYEKDTDVKIIISEYNKIAGIFCMPNLVDFVTAIGSKLSLLIRPNELTISIKTEKGKLSNEIKSKTQIINISKKADDDKNA